MKSREVVFGKELAHQDDLVSLAVKSGFFGGTRHIMRLMAFDWRSYCKRFTREDSIYTGKFKDSNCSKCREEYLRNVR
jgi:hypothetical protein